VYGAYVKGIQYTRTKKAKDKYTPTAGASIGIIGGAFGPTGIFLSGKGKEENPPKGLHGLPLYSCFSVPSFEREGTYHFFLEGINTIKYDSSEYNYTGYQHKGFYHLNRRIKKVL
jgi:hypothetical protein